MKNFAEFYRNQIEFASSVVLSRTDGLKKEKLDEAVEIIRSINKNASLITTPWDQLSGAVILETMEQRNTLEAELEHLLEEQKEHDHHHHHHHHHHDDDEECDDPECECHHHHDDDDEDEHEHGHHHHHHDDDDDEEEHGHHHHHHHDDDEEEHEHHHHHHHHDGDEDDDHDADEVFTSWGTETSDRFTETEIEDFLDELLTGRYGMVLRAKGMLASPDGSWIHFDYVPGEKEIRRGAADVIGKLCVIGTNLDKKGLTQLFKRESR